VNAVTYRLKLKKGDFELEVQGDREWVESKFEKLTTEQISIAGIKEAVPRGMPQTLGEFLDQKGNPQKHTDVVTIYAYWLFHVEKMNRSMSRTLLVVTTEQEKLSQVTQIRLLIKM